jgi:ABC-type multidrug transport system ATPase subunit/pSer/pThr/pTyr-binding forkhead associated (FHA) protein
LSTCQTCGAVNEKTGLDCTECNASLVAPGCWLVGLSGPQAGMRFSIPTDNSLQVGRVPGQNNLVIADPEISRHHAKLVISDGDVKLTDTSANGTFVNDRRVSEAVLQSGDRIRFGLSSGNSFVLQASRLTAATAAVRAGAIRAVSNTVVAPAAAARSANTLIMSQHKEQVPTRRLQLILNQYTVRDISLNTPHVEFGRDGAPGRILVDHTSISSLHAEITLTRLSAVLRDLCSKNGTFVNGERIEERVLQEGDLIQLGACDSHLFLYRESDRRPIVLRDIELDRPLVTIGRAAGNDIRLEHPTVSNRHAQIRRLPDGFELIDLGSTNGTFVNGQRIGRQVLRPSNRISLGAAQFVFDGQAIEQQSDGSRIRISCRSLCVEAVDFNTGMPIRLLDDISLAIEPCEFVGLLGPSGAGKSTLMDAMNGSRPAQQGQVLLNSADLYNEFASLRSAIGYVPQEDILHRQLTVNECLYYAARLRLPDDFEETDIWERVHETMRVLDLTERADLPIAQLSGGQRKRVSLGVELLSKPALLFVDEPTAGQDPRTEMKMMQLFREIANRGSTVVINTHLLGSFCLLDKVAVLICGKLAYFGPSQDMLPYFAVHEPHEIFEKLQERQPEVWAAQYQQSDLNKEFVSDVPVRDDSVKRRSISTKLANPSKRSSWRQLMTLLSRQFALKFKEKSTFAALLLPPMAIAVLMALLKQGPNEPKILLMMVVVALWFGCSGSVREIVDELPMYKRERQRDLKLLSYIGSKLVYVTSVAALQAMALIMVLTLMSAIKGHLPEAYLLTWVMTIEGALIGLVISAVCSTPEKALYAFPLTMIPQLLLAGLLIPTAAITPFYPVQSTGGQIVEIRELSTTPGMIKTLAYGVSPLMVSRWGLEGLSDLYVHDHEQGTALRKAYGYQLLSTVAITLHQDDSADARAELEGTVAGGAATIPAQRYSTFGEYVGILGVFALVFITAIAGALKRKESHGVRSEANKFLNARKLD